MNGYGGVRLAWRLALRELRGGWRGLRLAVACLALGVAAIAAVGSLRAAISQGLAADGARLLGGDIEVQGGSQPLPDALRDWLRGQGARIADTVTMRSMAVAPNGSRLLVELKAVDPAWPLLGRAETTPASAARDGVLVAPLASRRLGVAPGAMLRLGDAALPVRGVLDSEPDRVAEPSIFGPRVLIPLDRLAATGLERPGTIDEHRLLAVFPPGTDVAARVAALRARFPDTGWRIRDARHGAAGTEQFVEQMGLFLTLVGLASLLVGGVGVAGGVRAWLLARARGIAILRALGGSARLVLAVQAIQLGLIGGAGIVAGVAVGALLAWLAARLGGDVLPVPARDGPQFPALALAAGFGVLTAMTFGLAPLAQAMRIPGAALFREAAVPLAGRIGRGSLALNAAIAAGLAGLAIATSGDRLFALWFCLAALASVGVFRLGASALMRLAPRWPARRAWLRLGLANLHRPGAATPLLLVSVGLGLSVLASVALIQGNLREQVSERMPADAPRFFFIDIQPDELARFRAVLAGQPGVRDIQAVPSLRARMVALNGVPVERARVAPDSAWALRGDRGLTIAATMPEGTRLVAGSWWPADYAGAPLVSLDAGLARGWGVGIGDTLRVNVLGRDLTLTIASLRDVAWRTLSLNFTLVASPGLLSRAPYSTIATVRSDPADDAAILRAVTDALPNVSGIRVADVLGAIADLLGRIAAAVTAAGSLTLVAGALVLAGAVASGQQRRIREAVVLKTLGASRAQIRAAWLVEFGAIGVAAGVLAAAVGSAASWAVMRFVMRAPWSPLPATLAGTIVGCTLLLLAFGYLGTARALRARPAALLRNA